MCLPALHATSTALRAECAGVRLLAANNAPGKAFGYATAVGPDYLAFGAPGDDQHGSFAGAVYLFTYQNGSIVPQAKLTALDAGPTSFFGGAIAASGEVLLIGSERDSDIVPFGGSAYIFRRTGSTWAQEAKLTPPDGAAQDRFGSMVALSGDMAAVTAIDQDAGASGAGAVYVFVRSGSIWSFSTKLADPQPALGGRFGNAVGVSGEWVVVGSNVTNRARVYRKVGATWPLETTLTAVNVPPGETGFGSGLAIDGDFLAISALHMNDHQGVMFLFKLVGSAWTFQERKDSPDGIPLGHFGWSIGISQDHMAVGSEVTRKMFFYRRIGDQWRYESSVSSSSSVEDGFGSVVAIGPAFTIAGAPDDPSKPEGAGAGYAFALSECLASIPTISSYGMVVLILGMIAAGSWLAGRQAGATVTVHFDIESHRSSCTVAQPRAGP